MYWSIGNPTIALQVDIWMGLKMGYTHVYTYFDTTLMDNVTTVSSIGFWGPLFSDKPISDWNLEFSRIFIGGLVNNIQP